MWINRSGARREGPPRLRPPGRPGAVRIEVLEERLLLDGSPGSLLQPDPTPVLVAPDGSSSGSATISWISVTTGGATDPSPPPADAVVTEDDAPHATLATAQALPAMPDSALLGNLTPGAGPAVVQVPLDPSRLSLRISVSWSGTPPAGADDGHLVLLDASGRIVFDQALSAQTTTLTVMFQSLVTAPGGSFYVKLVPPSAAGNAPDGAAPASSGYVLRVTKDFGAISFAPEGMPPIVPGGQAAPPSSSPVATQPGTPTSPVTTYYVFAGVASWATHVAAGLPVTDQDNLGAGGSTDQGRPPFTGLSIRLPLAPPAPLGGIFTSHDPTPFDSHDDGVGVDLVLANLGLAGDAGLTPVARPAGTTDGPVALARPSLVASPVPGATVPGPGLLLVAAVVPAGMPGPPHFANGPGLAAGPAGLPASSALGQAALAASAQSSRRLHDGDRAELPDLGVAWSDSAPAVARKAAVRGPEGGETSPDPATPEVAATSTSGPVAAGSDSAAMLAAIVEEGTAAESRRPSWGRLLCRLYGPAALLLGLSAPDLSSALRRRASTPLRGRRR
jgi:hypothetical protein